MRIAFKVLEGVSSTPSLALIAFLSAAALAVFAPGSDAEDAPNAIGSHPVLRQEVTSDTAVWNGVVATDGAIYLAGPRWAGNTGAALVRIQDGKQEPFPDAQWNAWKPGNEAGTQFVNINAIRLGPDGALWVVDSGSPHFGGDPLPDGAKLVQFDLVTGTANAVFPFAPDIARPGSYIDDVRFHGRNAYLTDAGNAGLIVLDLDTGKARRVLDAHPALTARDDRPILVDGQPLLGPDGKPLKVHADPFELTPGGDRLLIAPLAGPWSQIPTALLDNPAIAKDVLAAAVEPFADLPPTGGTAMDAGGNLYFSDLATDAIKVRAPDGRIKTIAQDPRLHWVDAMFIDASGSLWMPAAQIDRAPLFQSGVSHVNRPVEIISFALQADE